MPKIYQLQIKYEKEKMPMEHAREYKNDVFCMLMQYKENALQVYNMLSGACFDDPELVEIMTLENGVSLTIRNDASFIIDHDLTISEHQSTYNPNMPLRNLIYFVSIIKKMISNKDLQGKHLIKLPLPHFVVFYNGLEPRPEKEILKLSDSYEKESNAPELELICTIYNINPNKNQELLSHCPVLSEYQFFVEKVREYGTISIDIEESVKNAIDYCIDHHILEDFLKERGMEVLHNMTFDFTYERHTKFLEDELEEKKQQITEQNQQLAEKNLQITEKDLQLTVQKQKIDELLARIQALESASAK